jgi:hypothetical protein
VILLISTLFSAGLHVLEPGWWPLEYAGAGCAFAGLALVIVAAILVIRENSLLQRAIDTELLDVPDLADQTGQKPGAIDDTRSLRPRPPSRSSSPGRGCGQE